IRPNRRIQLSGAGRLCTFSGNSGLRPLWGIFTALGQTSFAARPGRGQGLRLSLLLEFHLHTNMALFAFASPFDLTLAFSKTLLWLARVVVVAMMTADALAKVLRTFVLRAQRHAASATEVIFPRLKTMARRNPLVEP